MGTRKSLFGCFGLTAGRLLITGGDGFGLMANFDSIVGGVGCDTGSLNLGRSGGLIRSAFGLSVFLASGSVCFAEGVKKGFFLT